MKRVIALALGVAALAAAWTALSGTASAQGGELSRCDSPPTVMPPAQPEPGFTLKQASESASPVMLEFGTSRNEDVVAWDVDLLASAPPGLDVAMDAKFPGMRPRSTMVSGTVSGNGRRLEIRLCVDPSQPDRLRAGEYRGTVQVDDPRFGTYKRTIVVRLQHEPMYTPLGAVSLGAVFGAIWQWGTSWNGLSADEQNGRRRSRSALRGLTVAQAELVVAIVLGLILAFVSVFLVSYTQDPSWHGSLSAHTKLAVAGFAAATGAYGFVGLLHNVLRPSAEPGVDPAAGGTASDGDEPQSAAVTPPTEDD